VDGAPRASIRASLTTCFDKYGTPMSDAKAREASSCRNPGQPSTSRNALMPPPCHQAAPRPDMPVSARGSAVVWMGCGQSLRALCLRLNGRPVAPPLGSGNAPDHPSYAS
jgi:hypothetical protein